MTTCFDVYVIAGQGCHIVQTYPSQRHPHSGVHPGGPVTRREHGRERIELSRKIYEDEEALAFALLLLS